MFLAVPAKEEQIKDVFYLQLHLAIEMNMIASFLISDEMLLQHFKDGVFRSYVTCCTDAHYKHSLGCLVYSEDYSFENGHGLYIDSFYVIESLRNNKLGHLMMSRLCDEVRENNYSYIKLYFLNQSKLRLLYSKMGFCNETLFDKKLNLMEVYGEPQLKHFLITKFHPTECSLHTETVVSPVISTIGKSNVNLINVFQSKTNKVAGFTEQLSYCGWLGPVLLFTDFNGSTKIIDINIFKVRLLERQSEKVKIMGIWFEIPESHVTLINNLELHDVRNITKLEGWEIGCLYRYGTNDFSYFLNAFPKPVSIKCGTLDKMEVLMRNIYFC